MNVADAQLDSRRRRPSATRAFVRLQPVGVAAAIALLVIVGVAITAPLVAPGDPTDMSPIDRLRGPSGANWFGTDVFGRDVLSRILYGFRISIGVGVVAVLVAAVVGTVLGLLAGYFGRWLEYLSMRLMDVLFSFPSILLAILIVSIWGAGFRSIIVAIALVQAPIFARIVRASTLGVRNVEFVQAAVTSGAKTSRILIRHILPNIAAPILVQLALSISGAVIMEAALSYLGLGAVPPTPSLGSMLSENRNAMELAPWAIVFPGLALGVFVLCINLLGDALRDMLDPRFRTEART